MGIQAKAVCHIAYTHYESDPRVKREAEALSAEGYAVDFLSLKEPGYPLIRRAGGVNVHSLSPFRYRGNNSAAYIFSYLIFFMNVFIRLSLHPRRYRVLHFHTMPDFIVFSGIIPRLFGCRIVIDFHDVMHSIYESRFGPGAVITLVKLQTRMAAVFAHRVITVNTACRDIYEELGVKPSKIELVYNYPDEKLFYPRTVEHNTDEFRIICHGTVMERLGFDTLVRAVARIHENIPGVRLVIIGKGDYEQEIRNEIRACGIEGITDFPENKLTVDEVPAAIAGCDLGAVPTKIGPGTDIMLPLKLLEYIAMDIPAVTSGLPAIRRLCDDRTVIYFESNNEEDLAEKILDFYRQKGTLLQEMRKNMARFRTQHNWNAEAEKLTTLYSELI